MPSAKEEQKAKNMTKLKEGNETGLRIEKSKNSYN